ncbi:MAG: alpha/beta hydrolase [Proteobacteria bacterium]|nr:alpha/beta hydrolase [Pseudomonadota bacterium]
MEILGTFDEVEDRSRNATGDQPATAIALHCSGAGGAMWQHLQDALDGAARLIAPDLYGAVDGPIWPGDRAFSLDDEVAPIIRLIDAQDGRIHLIGHSYGGAIALHAALARAERIGSLTLYEPSSFHLLKPSDGIEYAEILGLARDVEVMLARGDRRGAMKRFVNYWSGNGSWDALMPEVQSALMRWAPKVTLDFRALFGEPAQLSHYAQLDIPCRIMVGTRSPAPTAEIARILADVMPDCRLSFIDGVGHMAPISHGGQIATLIADHIRSRVPGTSERSLASTEQRNGRAA